MLEISGSAGRNGYTIGCETRINGFKERDQVPGLGMVQFKIETDDCEVIVCYCFSKLGLMQ